MKWKIHRLCVEPASADQRLDQYLAGSCAGLSRTAAKKVIDLGGVHICGRRVRGCSRPVKAGDSIEVYLDHLPLDPYRIAPTDIVFQDSWLIVINKPAAIDSQPTHARFKGTVFEALQYHLQDPFRPQQTPELGMVQRLDRGTSGLMVFSIHQKAHKELTRIFIDHEVEKRYLALVAGVPKQQSGEIRSFLARSRKANQVKSVEKGGKEAITRYTLLETGSAAALLDIELLTGRSHQIRVHMSEQGWPLLGDSLYGGPLEYCGQLIERPLLHAAKLAFRHPVTGQSLDFSAEIPADFAQLLKSVINVQNREGNGATSID